MAYGASETETEPEPAGIRLADTRHTVADGPGKGGPPVSVEAISWALNLGPVPRDRGGKRNPACKAVLVGLANYAAPDGKDAFPSI